VKPRREKEKKHEPLLYGKDKFPKKKQHAGKEVGEACVKPNTRSMPARLSLQ